MKDFASYYTTQFKSDLRQFFSSIPDESRFHEDSQNKRIFSIQYERLTRDHDHLNFLEKSDKEYFGIALYFSILIDMVFYSDYKQDYEKFRKLTLYPKFIGNCLSTCHFHCHPNVIFTAMNKSRNRVVGNTDLLVFGEKFNEAKMIMEKETKEFLRLYMEGIVEDEFWEKCRKEFPYAE
jgi:hypothetical protein